MPSKNTPTKGGQQNHQGKQWCQRCRAETHHALFAKLKKYCCVRCFRP